MITAGMHKENDKKPNFDSSSESSHKPGTEVKIEKKLSVSMKQMQSAASISRRISQHFNEK
jgi:hypothetical protein